MTLADLDFEHGCIEVTGKGRRRRRVGFHPRTGKALLCVPARGGTAQGRGVRQHLATYAHQRPGKTAFRTALTGAT